MSVATKTRSIDLHFRSGTPRRVLQDVRRRYAPYLLKEEDVAVEYFETELHKQVSATMKAGLWVRHLREAHGWSQAELGEKLGGVKAARVSDFENNQRAISKGVAKDLGHLFKVSADRFI